MNVTSNDQCNLSLLNVPTLANHGDEGDGQPSEARNVDTVVTGDGSASVGRTNRFDDNHLLETRPFCQLRQGHAEFERSIIRERTRRRPRRPPGRAGQGTPVATPALSAAKKKPPARY